MSKHILRANESEGAAAQAAAQERLEKVRASVHARRTVSVRRNRQTGTIVETVSAQAQDLDDGNGETKWYNICQPHATLCGHRTLAAARWFAARPLEWCEDCNAEHGDGGEE
jgi:hypothetical protein